MGSGPGGQRYCRCGTRLALDNTGPQCAPCQRASRDKLIAPPQVPTEFWQTDRLRDAFAARHMGEVARAYREHPYHQPVYGGGIPQRLLGQWLGLSQAQMSRIENGPPIRNLDILAYWARILRIPPDLLWFDLPGNSRRAPAADCAGSTVSRGTPEGRGEDTAKRRDAMTLLGKALAAVIQPGVFDAVERVAAGQGRERVDRSLVSAHEEVAAALAGLYRSADPRSGLPVAMSYADDVLELLDVSMGESERAALNVFVVGIHAQVGLWACHMHRPSLAYRYLATACEVATGTHDRPLRARALGAFSYLFSSAPRGGYGGNSHRALELLDKALDLASRADGFTRGWLSTWRADQHATLGALTPARADIDAASLGLGSGDTAEAAGFFARSSYGYGMEGHLNSVRAVVLSLAGDVDASQRIFDSVQVSAANMRRRIATYGHQGLAQTHHRNPEAACDALSSSIRLAVQEHYAMGLERAIGVRSGFDATWTSLPAVRDLDGQLRALAVV
jgi:transcriptional regulator with XRE-family HTH domain